MQKFANKLLKNYRNILSVILTFTLLFPNLIAPIGVLPVFAAYVPSSVLSTDPNVKFVSSPKYVRSLNAGDLAAQVKIPNTATDVVFFLNEDYTTPIAYSQTTVVTTGYVDYRLRMSLAAGSYTVDAAYTENDIDWINVDDTGIVYSLDTPWATYVLPTVSNDTFRASDNPSRLRIDDQYEQFSRVNFTLFTSASVNLGTFTVNRADCDLRAAGSYVLCDVESSSTWTPLSEGDYYFSSQIYTKANNRLDNYLSIPFHIDSTKPVVESFDLVDVQPVYSDSIAVTAEVSDNSGVEKLILYAKEPRTDGMCVDISSLNTIIPSIELVNSGSNLFSYTFDTSAIDGEICLFAKARDFAANHSDAKSLKVTLDNTGPVAPTLLAPLNNSSVMGSSLTNSWTSVSDADYYIYQSYNNAGLTSIRWTQNVNGTSKTATNVAETTFWWRVKAVDALGNQGPWSDAWKVTVDNTAPSTVFTTPVAGTASNGAFNVSGITEDQVGVSRVLLYYSEAGQGNWNEIPTLGLLDNASGSKIFNWSFNWLPSAEGSYDLMAKAYDTAGNLESTAYVYGIFYDTTVSSSSFITPLDDSKYNQPIDITGLTTDNVGVDQVSIYFKNSADADEAANWTKITDLVNADQDTPFDWSYTWTPSLDGKYDLKVNGLDTAGNVENTGYAYNILYDTTDPVVDITSHTNGDIVTGNINIAGTVSDTNLWRYYFVIQNSSNATIAGPGTVYNAGPLVNVNLAWNTTLVPDGTYKIRLEARDTANNKGAASTEVVTIVVDNSAPTTPKLVNTPFVTHNGDIAGANVRNEVKFSESIDPSGVLRYEYQFVRMDLNGTKLQSGLANMNTYLGGITCVAGVCTWKPDYQDNNQWVFRIRAIDTVGNVSDWSNWNDASDSEFSNFTTTYNQYNLGSGIFSRPDYDGSMGNGSYVVRESLKPTSSITAPTGVFDTNNPNINITYSASDAQTEVKNVKLYSQAGDLLATSTTGEFNITLPSVDGSYCMYTRAEDIADDKALDLGLGNIEDIDNNCELEVRLDLTAPVVGNISFIMDFAPYLYGNGFIVRVPVSDAFLGVDGSTCEFTFDNGSTWEAGSLASGRCVIMKMTPNNTVLNVNVRVSDNVGNTAQGVAKVRTSDSENPTSAVVIDDVYSGPNVYTTSTIKGTATDSVSNVTALRAMIRRSSDNRYWNGSTFSCMLCFLPQLRTISTSSLPNWSYAGLPSSALSNGVTYLVTPMATDSVLHVATGTSDSFIWDSVAPINPTAVRTTPPELNENNISVNLSGASDALSGVKGYSYIWSLNATDTVDEVMDIDNTITSLNSGYRFDNVWYLHIRTVDNVMNWSEVSSFGPYRVDTVDPVTTVSGIDSDWHNTPVTVTFTCTDTDGSGCATTHYSINGAPFIEGNSVEISDEGYNTVDFYSVDVAGNKEVEIEHPQKVKIDITAPINPSSFITDPDINVSTQDNTVWVSWADGNVLANTELFSVMGAYDNLSGVDQYQYSFSMNPGDSVLDIDTTTTSTDVTSDPLNDGLWYFHMRTEDVAGNWSDTTSYGPFVIDNTKPVITRNGANVTVTQGNTYTDAGATAFDTQDGDLTAQIVTVNPVNTNVLGTYTVRYNVTDSAGNIADEVTRTVTVVAAPVVPAAVVVPAVQGVQDEEEVVVEEEEENGEVLGVCTVSVKVSGFVYLDKDNDGTKGDKEDGIEGISVVIYTKAENKEVAKVTTDNEGKWTVEVCSGQYYAKVVDPKDVKGYKIEADSNDFEVKDGDQLQNINFVYENTSSFNWWWLVLLALVVLGAGGYIYLTKKQKEEGK